MGDLKAAVSGSYIDMQKEKHGWKRPREERWATVAGAYAPSRNIGWRIAQRLMEEEFRVSCIDRQSGVDIAEAPLANRFEQIDTLVLAQGSMWADWIEDQTDVHIINVLDDVLFASMRATAEFVRQTIDKPYLKYIVYVGSTAHARVLNASSTYCAAKAGLDMFSRAMAWELAPKGYRVFIVHPSNVEDTPMAEATIQGLQRVRGIDREQAEAYWGALNVLPRWLNADDVAEVVAWLVSGKIDHLSGASLDLWAGQR